ncbi:A1 Propeptide [Oesophagostomum dentatum]|uniref:A1 Propeptide n=1 Tax=Oesophagostomum dentatum TaxID=61180 RepID=A0A0B1SDP8_OESDE|nr:A1 Propeptide [Oesophagostomum dentatum]
MWPILVLLAVLSCEGAKVYQMPLTKIDSPRVTMMRSGVWAKFLKNRNAERMKMTKTANDFKQRVSVRKTICFIVKYARQVVLRILFHIISRMMGFEGEL